MKKLIAVVATLAMVLSMSVCAFAVSTSSSASTSTDSSTEVSAPAVSVSSSETVTVSATAQAAPTTSELADVIGSSAASTAKVAAVFDLSPAAGASGTYSFTASNVTASNFVALLHWNGAKWEKVPGAKCSANGTISFSISSFSPFAIVTSTTPVSPQTGEMNAVVYASCAIMMAGAAVVLFNKSKKNA